MYSAENPKELPNREKNLFQQMATAHDAHDYKKAIKMANRILDRFPKHGETISMKGLVLHAQGKKKEGKELVKEGLMKSLTNFTCWHIMGIINQGEKDLEGARSSFQNALKYSPDNFQLLRDIASLEMHLRKYDNLVETRKKLLGLKPNLAINWLGFAVANYFHEEFKIAFDSMEAYKRSFEKTLKPLELSEALEFQVICLNKLGDQEGIISFLKTHEKIYLDKISYNTHLFKSFMETGHPESAIQPIESLIERNENNLSLYSNLLRAKGINIDEGKLSEEDQTKVEEIMTGYLSKNPRQLNLLNLLLQYLWGEKFRCRFQQYLESYLKKGVPSLFSSLKPLYKDNSKVEIIESEIFEYLSSMRTNCSFPRSTEIWEDPTILVWLLALCAQHKDSLKSHEEALELINTAIEHTNTLPELYMMKARMLKHLLRMEEAVEAFEEARYIDLGDRYLSARSVKYHIRINEFEKAESIMALFSKEVNNELNVHQMQCMWYELAFAQAYYKKGMLPNALQMYSYVHRHFHNIYSDQYDFHTYSLRKGALRAYIDMIQTQDNIFHHANYTKAVCGLIECYLKLDLNFEDYKDFSFKGGAEETKVDEEGEPTNKLSDIDRLDISKIDKPLSEALKVGIYALKYNPECVELHLALFPLLLQNGKWSTAFRSSLFLMKNAPEEAKPLITELLKCFEECEKKNINKLFIGVLEEHKIKLDEFLSR